MWLWLVRRRDLGRSLFAAVFPEFIAREKPGLRGIGRQGRSAGLVRPTAQRGLGPARLDGQAPQATVAGESDELGERRTAVDGPGDALNPTPRGERLCVQQARLTGSGQSAWRAIDVVCWPIRRSLFGGPVGRQACAAGWASTDPWRQAQRAAFTRTSRPQQKRGQCPLGLQQPAFGKTQDVATGDDQVIQHSHVHQRQCRLQCLREHLVGARRLG